MAEIVGIVSAGVGIASFAAQVFGSIKTLKDVYEYNQKKAPENLDKIVDRLEFLKLVLEKLEPYEGNPIVDRALRSCQSIFRNVEEALDVLLQKVNRKSPGKKANRKPAKFQVSEKIREQIDEIRSELVWVIMALNLSSSICLMPPSTPENGVQRVIDHSNSLSTVDSPADDKAVHRANANDVSALSYPRSPPITQRTSCRYWGFEYTPMSIIFGKCDNKRCDMKNVRWSFRLAFNKLSIKWAFLIDLEVILGFETLWKCKNLYITLSEAQDQLRMLDRSPSPLRHHVNPDGNNYVRELLYHGPWSNQNAQFALLSLLVKELDPFFLEYLAAIAKDDPGFGGSTTLQDAVLCGSEAAVDNLLSSVDNLENHRNFLGQTPLHLAVSNPHIFEMILDAGHDMDVTDRWGITPLMYAAAMGVSDVVQLLISKGANITTRATAYEMDFMYYASVRDQWDIIFESLSAIQLYRGEEVFQPYEWMILLRQKYNKKVAEDQDQRKREEYYMYVNSYFIVDHQKATYEQVLVPESVQYQPHLEMSEYAFWLQQEYLRNLNAENGSLREEWYERRTRWFAKLLHVMGVSKQKVIQAMEVVRLKRTRSEKIDVKAIIDQFTTSMEAS
ncbi:uncharacterized protein BHQ10_006077 [Talaromyces amestolkiae]|uniref:Uncharacterized protein n=1 Tax=Talaromyces amestolkiae TaxID=1196081 RepID=A0A364L2P2_TALAM|nr:uncharacterized protein BHQ10_006077 [Talaromyces amestolkiae]RAO70065.1 hypothetical protein BHQ10_006077 [Talaromyces amestolkiae]